MPQQPDYLRPDGTVKGLGFFGPLSLSNGGTASEYSIADSEKLKDKNGKYIDYPSLVPTLTKDEVLAVLKAATDGSKIPDSVYTKAEAFALERQKQGKPLFAQKGEQQNLFPELKRSNWKPPEKSNMPISQKEFADKLRKELPELKDFTDSQIVTKVLELRPDLVDKIENPILGDQQAEIAQKRAEKRSRSLVDPDTWKSYPGTARFLRMITDTMPGLGGIAGGVLSTPETLGTGTIPGVALGVGAGSGARGLANQALGLDDTTPIDKAKDIALDTGVAAITPGLIEALRAPIESSRLFVKSARSLEDEVTPRLARKWLLPRLSFLDRFAEGPSVNKTPITSNFDTDIAADKDAIVKRLFDVIAKDDMSAKPAFRINADGTFTNLSTGEIFDKAGKPILSDELANKFKLYFSPSVK